MGEGSPPKEHSARRSFFTKFSAIKILILIHESGFDF